MDTTVCIAYGALISFIVSALKRIPLINKYPKVFALALSTFAPIILLATGHDVTTLKDIITCITTQFIASVATHETVTHTINAQIDLKG